MAITITDGQMEASETPSVCNLPLRRDMLVREGEGESTQDGEEISFHRHCQKTVCSAYGDNKSGATWGTLYHGEGDLSNI